MTADRGELHHKESNVGPPRHFSTASSVASFSSQLVKEERRQTECCIERQRGARGHIVRFERQAYARAYRKSKDEVYREKPNS